eukprot:263873-Rhodomonas_salina.2
MPEDPLKPSQPSRCSIATLGKETASVSISLWQLSAELFMKGSRLEQEQERLRIRAAGPVANARTLLGEGSTRKH